MCLHIPIIGQYIDVALAWINYNMRCIEIDLAVAATILYYQDKLQHEMY